MAKHYKVKGCQVYHIPSNLTVGAEFDHALDAKAFVDQIPQECDIPDIKDHRDLIDVLRNHRANYVMPLRVVWETKGYKRVNNRHVPSATYRGVLEEINPRYGIVKLWQSTSSSWEREAGYDSLTLCVYDHIYTIGLGSNVDMKSQIKLWIKMGFEHKGDGLFVSSCGKYKTNATGRVKCYDARMPL